MTDKNLPVVAADDDDPIDRSTEEYLRAQAVVDAINAALPAGSKSLPPIPPGYKFRARDRRVIDLALDTVFELKGGVPAFWQWAVHNSGDFYRLYAKRPLDPNAGTGGGVTIQFNTAVDSNPLDRISVDGTGRVINLGDGEVQP